MQKLAGIAVSSDKVNFVLIDLDNDQFTLVSQDTLKVPVGNRPDAYRIVHGQLVDLLRGAKIDCVCIKASAVSLGGTKKAHLDSAELRGVTMAASAAAVADVRCISKAATSRNFGNRKVDEYVRDDDFWTNRGLGALKKGLREAAFTAISEFA